ncbi:unnamed protein product [Prunus brigantina]
MLDEVKNILPARCKRILLEGQAGSAWYSGEQVAMQSLGSKEPRVPKCFRIIRSLKSQRSRKHLMGTQLWNGLQSHPTMQSTKMST